MIIETILADAKAHGLSLLNLSELPSGEWQANFTDRKQCWEFARAPSAYEALSLALERALTTQGIIPQVKPKPQTKSKPRAPSLEDLGL